MVKTLLKEVKEYKLSSILTPLCMVGEVVCEMIIPILMAKIVDDGIYGNNMEIIFKIGGLMFVIAILGLLAGLGGAYYGANASAGFAKNLRKAMFDNIQSFSFANIDKFSTSGLVTRLTTDVTNIQNAYMMILRMAMRAPASLIIAMIAAFTINAKLASIYLVAVIFLAIIMVTIMGKTTRYFKQVFEKYDELNESVQENVSAIRVVKAYVREEHENKKFKKAAANIYKMFVKAENNLVFISPVMSATVYICILLVSWFGAHLIVGGELTTGNLMSLLTYCMTILMNLMMLGMIFVMMTMASASGKRIAEVIEEKSSITNKENPIMEVKDGSIAFEHVNFEYNEDSEQPVLKDINLKIKSGETIGIIGGTGSAKSSLVNLISRLYDVSEGAVKVGGVDVRDYDLETLRDQVSVVLQKNVLFSGSILDNLRWGDKNASEEECKRACQMACADEFIEKMPEGYNTQIEQGGTNVSGGQRQRLCIARALLKKPKILILDDSTSAVDTSTDAKIRKAFAEEIPGTTKLIIAQRISSVQGCDRIIVMDDGKVNGFGTHDELLKSNDIYREVYESQTGASGDADFDEMN
nr:ABC transporter ATP-binding protein [uncultured Butyrivibrio sp.]